MKWLVRVWLAVNVLVLVQALVARETLPGGELAMLMFLLNLPSSIMTGMGLNAVGFATSLDSPHSLNLLLVWLPFFTLGALQWSLLKWLSRKISSDRRADGP